jgi:hypothetical protein
VPAYWFNRTMRTYLVIMAWKFKLLVKVRGDTPIVILKPAGFVPLMP